MRAPAESGAICGLSQVFPKASDGKLSALSDKSDAGINLKLGSAFNGRLARYGEIAFSAGLPDGISALRLCRIPHEGGIAYSVERFPVYWIPALAGITEVKLAIAPLSYAPDSSGSPA
jgi:hypothetical protein